MVNLPLLFNAGWYLEKNPDVAAFVSAGQADALQHYLLYGIHEGRAPGPAFDAGYYLAQNPDVAAAVAGNPALATEHFMRFGQYEGRDHSPFISVASYMGANPDIAAAVADGLSPLAHLVQHGISEGRDLGNGVNLSDYANDPVFQMALQAGNLEAALARVVEVAPFQPPEPSPPLPEPAPDPQPALDGVQVSLEPASWVAGNNDVAFSLIFASDVQLHEIFIGSGMLSLSSNTLTAAGTSTVDVSMNANTGGPAGTIFLGFELPDNGAERSVSITGFTINGQTYSDILHPLGGSAGTTYDYQGLTVANNPADSSMWHSDDSWGWLNASTGLELTGVASNIGGLPELA